MVYLYAFIILGIAFTIITGLGEKKWEVNGKCETGRKIFGNIQKNSRKPLFFL